MHAFLRKLVFVALFAMFALIGIRVIQGLSTSSTTSPSTSTAANPIKPTLVGGGTGRIALAVFGKNQIYTCNMQGTELVHLAGMDDSPWQLEWAPNGTYLLLHSTGGNIDVTKADGSGRIRLVETKGVSFASWSPDSTRIAYSSYAGSLLDDLHVYVVNVDGTRRAQLTRGRGTHIHPAWSPDGTRIAFQFTDDPIKIEYAIHLVNVDGSGKTSIAEGFENIQDLTWSPDSTMILISAGDPLQIHVLSADGSQHKQLTNTSGYNSQARWSSDSKRIVYVSNADGTGKIYAINADGSGQKKLTNDPDTSDGYVEWSPDGQWITYTSTRINPAANCCTSCCVNVYVMKSDGSGQRKLTSEIDSTWMATWQP